jgi:hypothetical protein
MDTTEVSKDITHVHFAFVGITSSFGINIPEETVEQFRRFSSGKFPFRKVVSFGGWAELTDASTF